MAEVVTSRPMKDAHQGWWLIDFTRLASVEMIRQNLEKFGLPQESLVGSVKRPTSSEE